MMLLDVGFRFSRGPRAVAAAHPSRRPRPLAQHPRTPLTTSRSRAKPTAAVLPLIAAFSQTTSRSRAKPTGVTARDPGLAACRLSLTARRVSVSPAAARSAASTPRHGLPGRTQRSLAAGRQSPHRKPFSPPGVIPVFSMVPVGFEPKNDAAGCRFRIFWGPRAVAAAHPSRRPDRSINHEHRPRLFRCPVSGAGAPPRSKRPGRSGRGRTGSRTGGWIGTPPRAGRVAAARSVRAAHESII